MGYIPFSYAPMDKINSGFYHAKIPVSGVNLSEQDSPYFEDKCADIENMNFTGRGLVTRKDFCDAFEDFNPDGVIHGYTRNAFGIKNVVHIGTKLYAFSENDDEPSLLSDNLPDKDSIFCEFLSKLYIYCDMRVYSVDGEGVCCEEYPDAPTVFTNCNNASSLSYTYDKDIPRNLLSPRVSAEYRVSNGEYYNIPIKIDTSRKVEVFVDGNIVEERKYTVGENYVSFLKTLYNYDKTVKISFYPLDASQVDFDDRLWSCKRCTSFGGDTISGTRIFMTGSDKNKGVYYKSALMNPLYFGADEQETIGDGSEDITGLIKMYGKLMIFTEKSVYRMSYDLDKELGAVFSIKQISSFIGCDAPESIQLIDNRVVFFNSAKGVYIVDSADESGEHNIEPLSGCINKGGGKGLLDGFVEDGKSACSADFDRKYFLFVKDKAYIWDYDACAFQGYANYEKAQGKLVWTVYTDIACDGVFCSHKKLYGILSSDKTKILQLNGSFCKKSGFTTGKYDFTNRFTKKLVKEIKFKISTKGVTNIKFTSYADGIKYYSANISCASLGERVQQIKLPLKPLYGFSYSLECDGAEMEINDAGFTYSLCLK